MSGEPASPSPPVPKPKRRRFQRLLLYLVILLCGGVIGSGLTVIVIVKRVQQSIRHPEQVPARAAARLQRRLNLSDRQAKAVEAVFRRRQAALQQIRREVQPRIETELDRMRVEVAAILDPDQAARWNTWFEQKRRDWLPPPPQTRPSERR